MNAESENVENMELLITGGSGFIGTKLLEFFEKENITLFSRLHSDVYKTINNSLEDLLEKECIEEKYNVAIHLAGLAHSNFNSEELRKVNVECTIALARQLAKKGLKRFVFISSISVNGNKTEIEAFSEETKVQPHTDSAQSKYEAEIALIKLSKEMGFELVIIRPPLVYGNNAPGNFKSLLKLALKGIPLPFGLVNNSRSFISVHNLCDFIALATKHPKAANELFLVSDNETLSTKKLIQTIWRAKNVRSFFIPIPVFIFRLLFKLLNRETMSIQLFDNLEVDNTKAKTLLGWTPKHTMFDVFK